MALYNNECFCAPLRPISARTGSFSESHIPILACCIEGGRSCDFRGISGFPAANDPRVTVSPRHERAKSGELNPGFRQTSWRQDHHNPPNAPPSAPSGLKLESGNSGFLSIAGGGIARDRQARRSAAAVLPSSASAVAPAVFSTPAPSSPRFSEHQQQQQRQHHQEYGGQRGGRGSLPSVLTSSSTGAAMLNTPPFNVRAGRVMGRESAYTSPFGGQCEARDLHGGDIGGTALGLEGRNVLFGARHR